MAVVSRRRFLSLAGFASLALAGCQSVSDNTGSGLLSAPTTAVETRALGDVMGQGQVKVALLLPQTGTGAPTATSLRNAAEMALAEFNNPNIQLLVKDDKGTPQGAAEAAQAAINEGAEVILGPLFAQSVAAVGGVARQANVPVIGYSTDASVAGSGVYLLSFPPQGDVERIVEHASQSGRKSFAGLVPDNAYGTVVEAAFKETVARVGGRLVAFERYPADQAGAQAAAKRFAATAGTSADAIFVPGSASVVPGLVQAMTAAGVDTRRAMLLGTGLWDDPALLSSPVMAGARFAGADKAMWQSFSSRYRARYGSDPVRTASLAYDSVTLIAALVQTQGMQRFSPGVLTNSSGFSGVDGLFRFRPNGTIQRGLAVLEVGGGTTRVVAPAPRSFASAGL
ncbi:penicillin-binding protein activator [Agaricicola taiwanensis]|uniref:Penicillin-binding protein activator n=1 Tax=Agaricicola taiwanensis TaxID=591372 RepID=A0A8J3DYI3_9RHOB|nr:penicillin-binding protein activator [Agaricicola taiwanensis]GGE49946.1 penicillin-binding protein activator [Agaricicola taiwanensis]